MTMLMLKQMFAQWGKPAPEVNADDEEQQLEDLVKIFTRPDSERRMKSMLAKQLVQMEGEGMGFDMMNGTVILTERNKAAMKTLEKTLKDGKRDLFTCGSFCSIGARNEYGYQLPPGAWGAM